MSARITPITSNETTRQRLLRSLRRLLARQGFAELSARTVAHEAGVGVRHVYRLFGGLDGLLAEMGRSPEFWPPAEELLDGYGADPRSMNPEEQLAAFFKSFAACLRRRPETLAVLAWENVSRTRHVELLEDVRVRTALECFERIHGELPDGLDLTAVVAFLAAGAYQLAVWSRTGRLFGGLDLRDEADWGRLEGATDAMVRGAFAAGRGRA